MLHEVEARFDAALQEFWCIRREQAAKQRAAGKSDKGGRSAVTGGLHLDALGGLVHALLVDAGVADTDVRLKKALELPGYYRPEKQWDLLVLVDGELVPALEFKAQVGPSFGNNFNNRCEEAIGNAEDIWKAYREGRFGEAALQPLLGYVFILEDCARTRKPLRSKSAHFQVDEVFSEASYAVRYEWLLRRLRLEQQYSAVCLTLTTNEMPSRISHAAEDLSFLQFAAVVEGHVKSFLASRKAQR